LLVIDIDVKSIKVSNTIIIAIEYVMTHDALVFSLGFSDDLDFAGSFLVIYM